MGVAMKLWILLQVAFGPNFCLGNVLGPKITNQFGVTNFHSLSNDRFLGQNKEFVTHRTVRDVAEERGELSKEERAKKKKDAKLKKKQEKDKKKNDKKNNKDLKKKDKKKDDKKKMKEDKKNIKDKKKNDKKKLKEEK